MNDPSSNQPYEPGGSTEAPPSNPAPQTPAPARRAPDAWIWGIVLIVVGGLFLLQNFTSFQFNNWWAIFILIPAVGAFANAWRQYQDAGGLNGGVRKALFSGIIFTAVAAVFLFNLNFGLLWPVLLIGAGLAIFVNAALKD